MFDEKNISRLQKLVKLPFFGNFNEHVLNMFLLV